MTPEQLKIVKEHFSEIREYREVLSKLFKYRVSFNQAVADWFEKEQDKKTRKKN